MRRTILCGTKGGQPRLEGAPHDFRGRRVELKGPPQHLKGRQDDLKGPEQDLKGGPDLLKGVRAPQMLKLSILMAPEGKKAPSTPISKKTPLVQRNFAPANNAHPRGSRILSHVYSCCCEQ